MKNILILALLLCAALYTQAQVTNENKTYSMTSLLSKGEPAPKEYFTGQVWVNLIVKPEDNLKIVVGKVTFEPQARTNWHSHPHGQILIVTAGVGYYQEKGKPIQIIKEGDVVKIPVNVEHWHGASHNSAMTHTAIVPTVTNGTIWMKPVTDTDYNVIQPESSKPAIKER